MGQRKLELILLTGKITIYRTTLQIVGDIDLENYDLKSRLIVPLDEYLGIDKLPFKVSIRAMIEIAFWGQNQSSFKRAKEIIRRIYNIEVCTNNVLKITEFIGKIVFDYNYDKAIKIWDNRTNIDINCINKKGTIYIQADGAAVNTRVEDENGSTWKENKLGILFSESDLYKRKNKANLILHKEYVAYVFVK